MSARVRVHLWVAVPHRHSGLVRSIRKPYIEYKYKEGKMEKYESWGNRVGIM